jgi:hypothetical protein
VFVHVGEPKTGTTFLQQVLWTNKEELLESAGLLMPGPRPMSHWRAAQDLREIAQIPNDPAGPHRGAWDKLARQALRAPRAAVISHELLSAASAEQAARGIGSLRGAEVHVVLTVRDFASLIPAEWQETIKHRNVRSWEDWVGDIVDREADAEDRRKFLFWRMHDTVEILRVWGAPLPPEHVHVITVPPRGSAPGLLWQRFAEVLRIDPAVVDTERARTNASLGLPEVELLRKLNQTLPRQLPGWFYMRNVKDVLAHGALAGRSNPLPRLELPPDRRAWAHGHAEHVIGELRAAKYDVVGDLDELLPPPAPSTYAAPSDVTANQMLDAAVVAITALLGELAKTQGLQPDGTPASASSEPGRLTGPLRARLIKLSEGNRTAFRIRRAYWHLANAARHLRTSTRPGPSPSGN